MERKYKAFISYRHLPLETDVAKKLHRRIERYVIPAQLRRDGAKRLGLVFRDQDELPLSSNLSANIQEALDNAEFLIVICTPETSKSAWVLREISYFLEHHDRDHVLAVLADGTAEQAFPAQLTELRGEGGDLLDRIEPLAANIVADSTAKRNRLLKTESLRILAALIGCAYDELYRREQRYRTRRLAAASAVVMLVAAAFVGVLLNRNAAIREQLRQTQINESKALAGLSESAFREGDYNGAIRYALEALPSENDDRPYVPQAEFVLSRELRLYQVGKLAYDQSFEQETAIRRMDATADGSRIVTADAYGGIRVFDGFSGDVLWEKTAFPEESTGNIRRMLLVEDCGGVLISGYSGGTLLLSLETGETLWANEQLSMFCVSPDESLWMGYDLLSDPETLYLLRVEDGAALTTVETGAASSRMINAGAISPDNRYAATLLRGLGDSLCELQLLDLQEGTIRSLTEEVEYDLSYAYRLCFGPGGELILAVDTMYDGALIQCFDGKEDWALRFEVRVETGHVPERRDGSIVMDGSVDLLSCGESRILYGSQKYLCSLELETGERVWEKMLPGFILAAQPYENGAAGLALSSGAITLCSASGILSYDLNMLCFETSYNYFGAITWGEHYNESGFAIIPADHHNRVSLVRWLDLADMNTVAASETVLDKARFYVAADGERLGFLYYDRDSSTLFSYETGDSGALSAQPDSVETEEYIYFSSADVGLTGDGKWIIDGLLWDPAAAALSALPGVEDFSSLVSFRSGALADGSLRTAAVTGDYHGSFSVHLWRDGESDGVLVGPPLPEMEFGTVECAEIGDGGWLLLRSKDSSDQTWQYMSCQTDTEEWWELGTLSDGNSESLCLAEREDWFALRADGGIQIRNLRGGATLCTIESDFPVAALRKLQFACGDRLLMAFSADGRMAIYDSGTGRCLHSADYGYINLSFHSDAAFRVYEPGEGRLLIICDDSYYTESCAFLIETESWEQIGLYYGVLCYRPDTDTIQIKPETGGLYETHFLSLGELIDRGKRVIDRNNAGLSLEE